MLFSEFSDIYKNYYFSLNLPLKGSEFCLRLVYRLQYVQH